MSDESGRELVPVSSNELVRRGGKGVAGLAAGAGILLLRGLAGSVLGGVVGGVLLVSGTALLALRKTERPTGAILAGAGALTLLASFGVGSGLLAIAGVGLIGAGAWSLYRFWKGLQSRR